MLPPLLPPAVPVPELAPPLLGFVAQYMNIRDSYLVCLPLVFAALALVRSLPARRGLPAGETPPVPTSPHG